MVMRQVGVVEADPGRARLYENGWQSWSPSASYRLGEPPLRPHPAGHVMHARPGVFPPPGAFWGEGLLAVDPGDGAVAVFAAGPDADPVPSLRADVTGGRVTVSADGPVTRTDAPPGTGLEAALAAWAGAFARAAGVSPRPAPTAWCTWYHYFRQVTEADVRENLAAIERLELAVDVVQIDDGYQAEIGDWLRPAAGFGDLAATVAAITGGGRRAGIWVAPFLVSPRSQLAREHPDWLIGGVSAGRNWEAEQAALDITHPGAAAYLRQVFTHLRELGIDFFKLDFLYGGALDGRRADPEISPAECYRTGLRLIREAVGAESYLLGCGAPQWPSVGLVDAMRVSPDTAPHYQPRDGDLCQPAQRSAVITGRGRAWQNGRLWVADPDCLIARPGIERREEWADYLAGYGGLVASSDRLADLDGWGLEVTRRLLAEAKQT